MTPTGHNAAPAHQEGPLGDWAGLGDLVELTVDRLVAPVEGIHRAIAGRWIRLIMPKESPIPAQADRAIAGIYGTIRGVGSLVGSAIPMGARGLSSRRSLPRLWGPGAGRTARATANAIWGDELAKRSSALATQLELRSAHGGRVAIDRETLEAAYPGSRTRLVLMLHGWNETEAAWCRQDDDQPNLATALESEGRTCLLIRYNTGQPIAASGAALAGLITSLMQSWPDAVDDIDLVGHSMGGLVARSAVISAAANDMAWVERLRNLVTLGTPHLGSPIEKGLALAARALKIAPESRPLGDFLDFRSRGIKDLRHGGVGDADLIEPEWLAQPTPDGEDARVPASVNQHFATGVLTKDPAHPLGILFGDLVVRPGSGTGQGRSRSVTATNLRVFGGQKHTEILRDPEVHRQVLDWLA